MVRTRLLKKTYLMILSHIENLMDIPKIMDFLSTPDKLIAFYHQPTDSIQEVADHVKTVMIEHNLNKLFD